jgi:predicted aconitase
MAINYPPEFAALCRELLPDHAELHRLVAAGSTLAGHDLALLRTQYTPEQTVAAFADGAAQEVLDNARLVLAARRLYTAWQIIFYARAPHAPAAPGLRHA